MNYRTEDHILGYNLLALGAYLLGEEKSKLAIEALKSNLGAESLDLACNQDFEKIIANASNLGPVSNLTNVEEKTTLTEKSNEKSNEKSKDEPENEVSMSAFSSFF